jgi:hypothetical protein
MKPFLLCLMACFFMTGCQTVDPLDRAMVFYERDTFPEKLQQDTGAINEPILQHGRCNLYLATPGATVTADIRFCTYALTEKYLLVQEWDAANTQYTPFTRVDLDQVISVDWASFSRNKQVKLLESQRLIGISAVIDNGGRIDGKATKEMFETIKEQGIPSTGDNMPLTAPSTTYYSGVVMVPFLFFPYTYHYHRYHHRHYRHPHHRPQHRHYRR